MRKKGPVGKKSPAFLPGNSYLINSVNSVFDNFESFSDNNKRDIPLDGDRRFDTNKNKIILESIITYIKNTDRFSGSLFC